MALVVALAIAAGYTPTITAKFTARRLSRDRAAIPAVPVVVQAVPQRVMLSDAIGIHASSDHLIGNRQVVKFNPVAPANIAAKMSKPNIIRSVIAIQRHRHDVIQARRRLIRRLQRLINRSAADTAHPSVALENLPPIDRLNLGGILDHIPPSSRVGIRPSALRLPACQESAATLRLIAVRSFSLVPQCGGFIAELAHDDVDQAARAIFGTLRCSGGLHAGVVFRLEFRRAGTCSSAAPTGAETRRPLRLERLGAVFAARVISHASILSRTHDRNRYA